MKKGIRFLSDWRKVVAAMVIAGAASVCPTTVSASEYTIDGNPTTPPNYATLTDAIAGAIAAPDTTPMFTFVNTTETKDVTTPETSVWNFHRTPTGFTDVTLTGAAGGTTLKANYDVANTGGNRLINAAGGVNLTLDAINVEDAKSNYSTSSMGGAGIFAQGATGLSFTDVGFTNNMMTVDTVASGSATLGGAIYVTGATQGKTIDADFTNVDFINNTALHTNTGGVENSNATGGGAYLVDVALDYQGGIVSGNKAENRGEKSTGYVQGGGLALEYNNTIVDNDVTGSTFNEVTFSNNTAEISAIDGTNNGLVARGGGLCTILYWEEDTSTGITREIDIENSTFSGNGVIGGGSATAVGGAIMNYNIAVEMGDVDSSLFTTITDTVFENNYAQSDTGRAQGGAIWTNVDIDIVSTSDTDGTKFDGNTVTSNGETKSNAIHLAAGANANFSGAGTTIDWDGISSDNDTSQIVMNGDGNGNGSLELRGYYADFKGTIELVDGNIVFGEEADFGSDLTVDNAASMKFAVAQGETKDLAFNITGTGNFEKTGEGEMIHRGALEANIATYSEGKSVINNNSGVYDVDKIIVTGSGTELLLDADAGTTNTIIVSSKDADAILVEKDGKLTVDTGVNFDNVKLGYDETELDYDGILRVTLDDGTMAVTNSAGTLALNTARSNANIMIGENGGTLDVTGAVNLTLTDDSKIVGDKEGYFVKKGTGTLTINGEVNIDGDVGFYGGDVTVANEFNAKDLYIGDDTVGNKTVLSDTAEVTVGDVWVLRNSELNNSGSLTADGDIQVNNGALIHNNGTLVADNLYVSAQAQYTDTVTSNVVSTGIVAFSNTSGTTINSSDFKVGELYSASKLTLAADANVAVDKTGSTASNPGQFYVTDDLELKGNAKLSSENLYVAGNYSDMENSTVTVADTAGFYLKNTNSKVESTINGKFSAENLILGTGLDADKNVKVTIAGTSNYSGGKDYDGFSYSELDASAKDLTYTGGVYLSNNATLKSKELVVDNYLDMRADSKIQATGLTVGGRFYDLASSTVDLGGVDGTAKGDLRFKTGDPNNTVLVQGKILNAGNITAQDKDDSYLNLRLMQGVSATGTLAAANTTFTNGETYNIGQLDIHGDFRDNGATTNVAESATIAGSAYLNGSFNAEKNVTVKGAYVDTADTNVVIGERFTYREGIDAEKKAVTTINSRNFHAGSLDVGNTQSLLLANNAQVIVRNDSTIDGTLTLNNGSSFGETGATVTNNGIVELVSGQAYFNGNVDNKGSVVIGSASPKDANLHITGNWTSADRSETEKSSVIFNVDSDGNIGTLTIEGAAKGNVSDNVVIDSQADSYKNKLGAKISGSSPIDLITATDGANSEDGAFDLNEMNSNTDSWKFSLTPGSGGSGEKVWQLGATSEVVTPDISSFFLTNIIGFDLPRAQNVSGPWVRMKGGHIDDDRASLDKVTFQMLQVGWDKSFVSADGKGNWYAGIFMEGDWMYGRGNYYRQRDTDNPILSGALRSTQKGMGTGLYLSRGFQNGWYVDLLGRISIYDTTIDMNSNDTDKTASYSGKWTEQIFALGLEIGKTFNSKSGKFSFNPYNRLIYSSAPGQKFDIVFESTDSMPLKVRNRAVDASTNQLGGRLYVHSLNGKRNLGNVFVGGDYFQGLSGRFRTDVISADNLYNKSGDWQRSESSRSKNNLSYGQATVGITFLPRDNFAISSQADFIFGDVEGWALTLSGRYSY